MDETLEIADIQAKGNRIYYTLIDKTSQNLLKSPRVSAWICFDHADEFALNLSELPLSVLSIPMTLYLLPATYYYSVNVKIPVMDKMLYDALPAIRATYAKIYGTLPESVLYKRTGGGYL